MMSIFDHATLLPEDPILSIPIAFAKDERRQKVNLGVGAYRDEEGMPFLLPCVKKAEKLLSEQKGDKEYLPITGYAPFVKEALKIIFGDDSPLLSSKNLFAAQTIGCSGALRVAGEIMQSTGATKRIYISKETWPNHHLIFKNAGMSIEEYPYYDPVNHKIAFDKILEAISKMEIGSCILLQACCHNPTGTDFTMEQWKALSEGIKKRRLLPLFDISYQGFGEGLVEDAAPIVLFANEGHELLITYSFAKNFGLYGERIGLLALITKEAATTEKVASHIKTSIRGNYSTPSKHGAKIVSTILTNVELKHEWLSELSTMRSRIQKMRHEFYNELKAKINKPVEFLIHQRGMFSFSGLTSDQVAHLKSEYGIYILSNGRINVAGLNANNLKYVTESIAKVI